MWAGRPKDVTCCNESRMLAISAPRRILAVAVLVMVAAGIFGIPVAKSLSASGFQDPTSESSRATQLLTDKFGQGDMQMLITVTAEDQVARRRGAAQWSGRRRSAAAIAERSGRDVGVDRGAGRRHSGQQGRQDRADRRRYQRRGERRADYTKELAAEVTRHPRRRHRARGRGREVNVQITQQSQRDLLLMESIAIPFSFLVLVWVFGGLLAAALPLAVGVWRSWGRCAAAANHVGHRRVDLRAEPHHRDGTGHGDRLHIADTEPLPRRTCRRRRPRTGCSHHVNGRAHRAVLGDDRRPFDARAGIVPDVLPEIVRLRGHHRCGVDGVGGISDRPRRDHGARRPHRHV